LTAHINRVRDICEKFIGKLDRYELTKPKLTGRKRERGISISDLHLPFTLHDILKDIIKQHSGEDFCVVNGDLFDMSLVNSFMKHQEVPLIEEYNAALFLIRELATNFGEVILVGGNHDDGRYAREISKINPTMMFLVKESPLQHLAEGRMYDERGRYTGSLSLPNVHYVGDEGPSWWYRRGQTIFCHRLRGFRTGPMRNATFMADHFLRRGIKFQCCINGHSHHLGWTPYTGGRLVIDQGALCLPQHYEVDGGGGYSPIDVGYAVVEMDNEGNVNFDYTRPVYLGTYQEK
jgi:predicted phosphodiesterase